MSKFIQGNMIHDYMIDHNIPTTVEKKKIYYIIGSFNGRQINKIDEWIRQKYGLRASRFDSSVDVVIYTKTMPSSLLRPYRRFKEVEYIAYEELFDPVLGTDFFMNKHICLLGSFIFYDYEKVKKMFLNQNCIIQNRVISSTDVLVCGDDLTMQERLQSYQFNGIMITERDLLKYIV